MKALVIGAFAALGVMSSGATAGVIYHWEQLTSSSTIDSSSGTLEIADAAWLSGHIDLDQECFYFGGGCTPSLAESPILHFLFSVNGFSAVDASPAPDWISILQADLDISADGALSGYLYGEDDTGFAELGGQAGNWTVSSWRTDQGCWVETYDCHGATGRWVLDPSTVPTVSVPEPNPLPFFSLGTLAVLAARYRLRSGRGLAR